MCVCEGRGSQKCFEKYRHVHMKNIVMSTSVFQDDRRVAGVYVCVWGGVRYIIKKITI